ncbi:hypothetical protein ABH930_007260 [Kitasatospora sp. GAS204A]|nr:hypothetical protein [Kitasatospora sp. GAS204B]
MHQQQHPTTGTLPADPDERAAGALNFEEAGR